MVKYHVPVGCLSFNHRLSSLFMPFLLERQRPFPTKKAALSELRLLGN